MIDDRVDADCRLAGSAVADDQFALAASDRDHRVDGLQSGLEWFLHGPAVHHAGRVALDGPELLGADRAFAVHRLSERVHDSPDERFADRHLGDAPGASDDVTFLDLGELPEEHAAHLILLEVEHHPDDFVREL